MSTIKITNRLELSTLYTLLESHSFGLTIQLPSYITDIRLPRAIVCDYIRLMGCINTYTLHALCNFFNKLVITHRPTQIINDSNYLAIMPQYYRINTTLPVYIDTDVNPAFIRMLCCPIVGVNTGVLDTRAHVSSFRGNLLIGYYEHAGKYMCNRSDAHRARNQWIRTIIPVLQKIKIRSVPKYIRRDIILHCMPNYLMFYNNAIIWIWEYLKIIT